MKKTPLKKISKAPISKIQRDIWVECRRICGKQYGNKNGGVDCYTCGARNLEGSNRQLGHLFSKATLSAFLKYDLRVLRWQCMRCNIHGGGMGADYYKRMLKEEGKPYMDLLERDRQKSVKAYDHYLDLLEYYKSI